jgi:hypothetical protein
MALTTRERRPTWELTDLLVATSAVLAGFAVNVSDRFDSMELAADDDDFPEVD